MGIAIVTGASSGIGREFVRRLGEKKQFTEIWAIARRKDKLEELQKISSTVVRPIPLDLSKYESIQALSDLLEREKPDVRILINSAGFGKLGTYRDQSLQEVNEMIDVNCKAAVNITLIVLPYMHRGARILEVCSAAGFQPLPGLNVYAASKAFLLSFSRALRWELFPRMIKVTAVCPDWVKTEFFTVIRDTKNNRTVRHFLFPANPQAIVSCALFDSALGLPVSTFAFATLHRIAAKFIPAEAIIAFWEGLRRI